MNKHFFLSLIVTASSLTFVNAQSTNSVCGLEVQKAVTQEVAGKNIGFFVEFKNTGENEVDAIEYKVSYMDGFEKVVEEKLVQWQSGNIIKPIKPGAVGKNITTNWVKGANKIKVTIKRVHYTDGTTCKS
jgi:archaellum component FlaG (FlaF/FlaG flagellin family)